MTELKTILDKNSFVNELNSILNNGGIIAFVTDTVWGLGCLPNNKKGVNKIYELKNRDTSKPLILMSDKIENLTPYVKEIPQKAQELINDYFPGALTLVLKKSKNTPDFITSNKDTVGIRLPNNEFFKLLCSKIDGGVLATTSANLSNQPSAKTFEEAKEFIGEYVDFVFEDYEQKCNGLESTVALITNNDIKVLRQGSVNL